MNKIPMNDDEVANALCRAILREKGGVDEGSGYLEGFLDGLACFTLHPEWSAKVLAAMIRWSEAGEDRSTYDPQRFEEFMEAVTV